MKFKHIIKILLSGIVVKISSGPLKGKKWIVSSGTHFIKGTHEVYKADAFVKNFKKGDILYDIGAHFGYFSSIAALINDGSGWVYAFEPLPMNIRFFKKHIKVNNFQNVSLFETAVGEKDGEVSFDTGSGSATGHVSKEGKFFVKQVSISSIVSDKSIPLPDFIKIDVEGGEIEVLKGLKDIITTSRPKMLVATHNTECHKYVMDFLQQNNYTIDILNPEAIRGDTEIMALPR